MSSAFDAIGDALSSVGDVLGGDLLKGTLNIATGGLAGQFLGTKDELDMLDEFERRQKREQEAIQKREQTLRQNQARAAISDRGNSLFDLLGSSQER